ncbi:PREDICTED: uncharacterized protein LOC105568887 [Vollenhovia emeryi]|uniref:uncharacterized protein LOC105568887 n=1 Tax=Vollenhovia emeryi TaxID=411798 RepID=UPI0005F3C700|nr:PREDICTED: uncharacterized protein LOC105568887 [Vollenhovia emeryi]
MMITFVQKSLILFAVLLCYYQSCVSAADCEQEPYHPSCRGSQVRKRLMPLPVMRALNCEDGDCRLPRMKFLIAILDDRDTPYRNNEVHPSDANSIHTRREKGKMRMEDSYMDDY